MIFLCSSCSSEKQARTGSPPQEAGQSKTQGNRVITGQDEQLADLGLTVPRIYGTQGIQINYQADKYLNFYEDKSHTLLVVVYQLGTVNSFSNLAKDQDGVSKLLKGKLFDDTAIYVNQFFIEPGEKSRMLIDRFENVKWVGIVAGYYDMILGRITGSWEIPVTIEKKGTYGFRKMKAKIAPLIINLYLGPYSLQEVSNQ